MARYGISERPDMAWHSTSVEIMNASAYCECEWLTVLEPVGRDSARLSGDVISHVISHVISDIISHVIGGRVV